MARGTLDGMTSPMLHDTPLIPWEQEMSFIEGVAIEEARELGVDELLARATASETAAAAAPARAASEAGTQRSRQRLAHQAQVYRRLAAERHA
jgi:hypothetical protein